VLQPIKCPTCQREVIEKKYNFGKTVIVFDCNCEAEAEREAEIKAQYEYALSVSKIPPYFQDSEFSKIDERPEKETCVNYLKNFDTIKNETQNSLFLCGDRGRGKTTLLACIGLELLKKGKRCLYLDMTSLIDMCMERHKFDSEKTVNSLFSWLKSFDFIILDDFGKETYTEKRLEFTYRVINYLVNHKVPIGITAKPEKIAKLNEIEDFGDILDRLAMKCNQVTFKGESFRRMGDIK